FCACAQPDWWVRFLERLGLDMNVLDTGKLPFKCHFVFGPQTPDQAEVLSEAGRPFFAGEAKAGEFIKSVPLADPEIKTPLGKVINEGHILGHAHRMIEGEQQHKRTDAYAVGAGGDRGSRVERCRIIIPAEVVLGEPDIVVAELLGAYTLGQ